MTSSATDKPSGNAAPPPKVHPEDLALRATPRPVTRINRRVLMLLAGTGLVLICVATIFALDPPRLFDRDETGRELYTTQNRPTPDGLDALPRRYSDMKEPAIKLGPPLTGDVGPAVVGKERELGLRQTPSLPFRPDPEEDALRAERIRQARLAQQARESNVFFKLTTDSAGQLLAGLGVSDDGGSLRQSASETQVAAGQSRQNLFASAGDAGSSPLQLDLANDQNLQGRKLGFLNDEVDEAIYNPHKLQDPASPYQIMAGTIIPASLVTGINSDLPGQIIAQVTENVHDTVTGQHLLIPQGTRVIGNYDSVIAFGQSRALVVWRRLILPDGSSIVIENLPATDTAGYAGLEDKVNFHTWRLLKGVSLSTLLGVGTELTFGNGESDLVTAIRESAQDNANQTGQSLTQRNLNIQPTITIRPGWPLRIIVNKDKVLRPYRGPRRNQ
ncbi:TrbI/VirB10 family protein [Hoeflea poritis]|uniref:Conjugal transfer protein TrbI n=1 Tax=Hoeflea poritis TaxID=2993659 RepID=A0ABT4VVR5_9HYPH|nr:TrbI/VirB10 family protein [Hoeflea poritis]MDA4848788.1 conjugal transfer protein TrbI [Hoeflea poritis]